jgi:hypothetical protein
MTTLPKDYILYLNAREWLRLQEVTLDAASTPEMKKDEVIQTMAFGNPVILRGTRGGRPVIFVIVSQANSFTKQANVRKVMTGIPEDGSADVIVASATKSASLGPNVINIEHEVLEYNVLRHVDAPTEWKIYRGPDTERIKYDFMTDSLGKLARMNVSSDPFVFWAGLQKGDVVAAVADTEDTFKQMLTTVVS